MVWPISSVRHRNDQDANDARPENEKKKTIPKDKSSFLNKV